MIVYQAKNRSYAQEMVPALAAPQRASTVHYSFGGHIWNRNAYYPLPIGG
jgi:hypothetical protein